MSIYSDFVLSRVKPAHEILQEMTAQKAHVAHMALGLAGELFELRNADTLENEQEELGDIAFYLFGLYSAFADPSELTITNDSAFKVSFDMTIENIVDTCKKYVFYNKPIDVNDLLHNISRVLAHIPVKAIEANMEKLKKRYPTTFSNKDAQERKDKL